MALGVLLQGGGGGLFSEAQDQFGMRFLAEGFGQQTGGL
jgi:hypothetical protein